jgi:CspA family cold shock protein
MSTKQRGTVKWFDADRGFGFLKRSDGGDNVFVHVRSVVSGVSPLQGDVVWFEVGVNPRTGRTQANNVQIVGDDGATMELVNAFRK